MGMPHKNQIYVAVLSTSKSMYASGQPALYMADKDSLPFLVDHYQRVATGPTSVFVHDLPYYRDTLDDAYMPSVWEKLGCPVLVDTGVLRIALTGFDKSKHDEVLPKILERLDFIMSLGPDDEIVTTFKQYNPFYASTGKSSKTVMG